jgi:hypothetical protein
VSVIILDFHPVIKSNNSKDVQLTTICCNITEMGKCSAPGAAVISIHHAVNYSVHTLLVWEQAN